MQNQIEPTERELKIRNYSPKTIKSYIYGLKEYFAFKKKEDRFWPKMKFEPIFFQVLWQFLPRKVRRRFQVFLWRQILFYFFLKPSTKNKIPVIKGTPPIITPFHSPCEVKIMSKYLNPKRTKIQPPTLGHFQATIAAPKAKRATNKCIKESCQPNSGLNPSKINIEKKTTIKIANALGK